MRLTPPDRRVITFYSYKGGVGRTMALANVAYRLANTHGLKVIAIDWDLEAPGLHRYFGVPPEVAESTNGILDYFLAWGDAVGRGDPEPPPEASAVTSWILPIVDEAHRPKFGEVSVLLAGKQGKDYDARLARFDWRAFYGDRAGAVAVESLREKLVEKADVVLVDSRTGLTDAGGVCTIQLPDGVVLMTAPNDQSLEGTERVARAIARATTEERAQRGPIKAWLAIARVPSNEEGYLAQQWFKRHQAWFQKGIEQGLWSKEDHNEGIRSLEIPHMGRWGFEEAVLREDANAGSRDPLALAYEHLTGTLLRWVRGEPSLLEPRLSDGARSSLGSPRAIAVLEAEAAHAEQRGDVLGLGIILVELATALNAARRTPEAVRKLEQAIGIFVARGAATYHLNALGVLGSLLLIEERFDESEEELTRALKLARELEAKTSEALALGTLAGVKFFKKEYEKAIPLFDAALTHELSPNTKLPLASWRLFRSEALYHSDRKPEGVEALRHIAQAAREEADVTTEARALEALLKLTADAPLPDADALRARLAELPP